MEQDKKIEDDVEQEVNDKATVGRKKNKPQRNFPQYSMEEALQIAKSIANNNAGNPWGPEQIATALDIGARSTNFYYLAAASRDYGYTTGTSRSKEIELTALGRKIVYPVDSEQEAIALIKSFQNIDIFKKVSDYYKNGNLPEKRFLFNTLQENFSIPSDFHEEFYDIYLKNFTLINDRKIKSKSVIHDLPTEIEDQSSKEGNNVKRELFVIMPFSEKTNQYPQGYFDEVFSSLIVPAAAKEGYIATTANRNGSDIIHKTIVNNIFNAELILADLTEHNPNVLFELGLAIAFKKKVAIIRAQGTKAIFDVDNSMRVLDYSPNLWKSTLEMDIERLSSHISATSDSADETYLDIFLSK